MSGTVLDESQRMNMIRNAMLTHSAQSVGLLLIGEGDTGKTTFCQALFDFFSGKQFGSAESGDEDDFLKLKSDWDSNHEVGKLTTQPGARVVRLNAQQPDPDDDQYLMFLDLPGSYFSVSHRDYQTFVEEVAQKTAIWLLVCNLRSSSNALLHRVDKLLDMRGDRNMPYIWILGTHCDGRKLDGGKFDAEINGRGWGKEWADARLAGFDGLIVPPRLSKLGLQYDIPFKDLIGVQDKDQLFSAFAEMLNGRLPQPADALNAKLKEALFAFGEDKTSVKLWDRLCQSNKGVSIALTGYGKDDKYGPVSGFGEQLLLLSAMLLWRPGRGLVSPAWSPQYYAAYYG